MNVINDYIGKIRGVVRISCEENFTEICTAKLIAYVQSTEIL